MPNSSGTKGSGAVGRFLQPDSIVPDPGNPQSLNRYSYVLNNPLRYTDPTGHGPDNCSATGFGCFAFVSIPKNVDPCFVLGCVYSDKNPPPYPNWEPRNYFELVERHQEQQEWIDRYILKTPDIFSGMGCCTINFGFAISVNLLVVHADASIGVVLDPVPGADFGAAWYRSGGGGFNWPPNKKPRSFGIYAGPHGGVALANLRDFSGAFSHFGGCAAWGPGFCANAMVGHNFLGVEAVFPAFGARAGINFTEDYTWARRIW